MPISFPFPPSSGQRYDYLSQSWLYNGTYWASIRASGAVTSGQLGTPVVFSGNIASGQIGTNQLASGVGGGGISLVSGSIISGYIGDNAVTSGNIASGQIGRFHINDFNVGIQTKTRGGTAGYFAGGNLIFSTRVATTDKLVYSNDTTAAQTTANLSQARNDLAGVSEGLIKGYFAGGNSGATVATADKLTYSNDTTIARTTANLSQARYYLAGCSGEGTKGYFAGGYTGAATALTDKIIYSNDTTASQTTANLSQARFQLTGISEGSTKGYFAGGTSDFANRLTTAEKIEYSSDATSAQTTANLSQGRSDLAGCSGEGTKGYFGGGNSGSSVATANKLIYSTDTTSAQTTANLSQARNALSGISEGLAEGYFAGGNTGVPTNLTDKITYSTDITAAQTTANLSQSKERLASAGQEFTSVFGNNSIFSGNISSSELSINHFSSGTFLNSGQVQSGNFGDNSIVSGNIASGQIGLSHLASGTIILTSGQVKSGNFGNNSVNSGNISSSEIGQYHFAFNYLPSGVVQSGSIGDNAVTSGNIGSGQILPTLINDVYGQNNIIRGIRGGTKGYFAGGISSSSFNTTDKTTFSTDATVAQTTANLTQAKQDLAGVSDGIIKCYFAGGNTGTIVATATRTNFFTDATINQTSANLSQARSQLSGVYGNSTNGYFAGGTITVAVSVVATADKIIYSTDTTAAQTTANLSQARTFLAGVSEGLTKGYFAGGNTNAVVVAVATADKITYSTDTTVAQTSANLSVGRYVLAGCNGEGTAGYFAGGGTGGTNRLSTTDKLTYSTDITVAQTTANLSVAKNGLAGISEGSTKGYFAGGNTGVTVATADKITFTNDTTVAQTTANLSAARTQLGGAAQEYSYAFGNNSVVSGNIASGQVSIFHMVSGVLGSGKIASGMFADNSVVSGSIASGRISDLLLSSGSITSGSIASGSLGRFALADSIINSGLIYSGGLSVTTFGSGALSSFNLADQSVNSGEILSGRIDSPHISSGAIADFDMASGLINASGKLNSGSVFNLSDNSLLSGNFGATFIGPDQFANNAIQSGNISSGIIGNFAISSGGVGSGALASGQIYRFTVASGAVNSGHFGDNALSSGSFNFGCVDGNSLVSGLWAVPTAQLVSGGITAFMFAQNAINENSFRYVSIYTNAGYFAGGQDVSGNASSSVSKTIYSTDTTVQQLFTNLSQARFSLAGCSGDGLNGYFAGGTTGSSIAVAITDKITYLTDTMLARTSANLSQARFGLASVTEGTSKGYFAGGSTGTNVLTSDKITYSTDITNAQTSANIIQAVTYLAGCSDLGVKGYIVPTAGLVLSTNLLTYSTDTTISKTTANISQGRNQLAGCSGEGTKGYFAGGVTGGTNLLSTTDKTTYSTDTTAAQTTANLSQARYSLAGISDGSTKGYFAGGFTTLYVTTADKITYSTDTTVAQTSANLSVANRDLAGVDGGNAPEWNYSEIVTSGKLTTTAANEIRSTNLANNSVFSGQLSSNSIAIFSVIGGYTPFTRWFNASRNAAVNSGHIPPEEIGPSAFAPGTVLSGNLSSGLIIFPEALGDDQIRSGNIFTNQINSGHFSSNDFIVTSSMIGSGQINATTLSGQNAGPIYPLAETAEINTRIAMFDYFRAGELISGIKAVCIGSGNLIRRAERASGLRLPAIGCTSGAILSGTTGQVFYYGFVGRAGATGFSGMIASGFHGRPLYVGSGGLIVNLSGYAGGASSGAPFLSGNMQQQIGIAMSGGLFVMPSPLINRSGFQGILPYNI